jgi:hypothetical protein
MLSPRVIDDRSALVRVLRKKQRRAAAGRCAARTKSGNYRRERTACVPEDARMDRVESGEACRLRIPRIRVRPATHLRSHGLRPRTILAGTISPRIGRGARTAHPACRQTRNKARMRARSAWSHRRPASRRAPGAPFRRTRPALPKRLSTPPRAAAAAFYRERT